METQPDAYYDIYEAEPWSGWQRQYVWSTYIDVLPDMSAWEGLSARLSA